MNSLTSVEKPKEKKKSFVERIVNFASHTMRINKKSERSKHKKDKKKSGKYNLSVTNDKRKLSKSLMQLDIDNIQTCTFCDFCDEKIVADFTGQNIICHESCKENHKPELSMQSDMSLQSIDILSSIKSEKIPFAVRETGFVVSPEILDSRLSISLDDITFNGLTIGNEPTLRLRPAKSRDREDEDGFMSDLQTGSYTFSTVDLPTIKHYGITIKKVSSVHNEVGWPMDAVVDDRTLVPRYMERDRDNCAKDSCALSGNLKEMMDVFNDNDQGLLIEPKGEQIMGKIRVFINLLRPIKMLLTARPPSIFDIYPENSDKDINSNESTLERVYYNKEMIFWLPRGTTKLLYINVNCPTMEVISILLSKFNIKNNPKKFALYEHTVKSQTEVEVRKLRLLECPLKIMLDWCTKDIGHYHGNLVTKRFVLQENDPGSIEWDEFSIPELTSFLGILRQEEDEKRNDITRKYDILRTEILRRMTLKRTIKQETVSVYL